MASRGFEKIPMSCGTKGRIVMSCA